MRKTIVQPKAIADNGSVTLSWLKSTPLFKQPTTHEFDHFRIYRTTEEAFTFGADYEEFFLNTDGADADQIFEGGIEAINDRAYVFRDDSVETGHTYSYFVQTQTSCRMGPIPVRVRDPDVWWSYDYMLSRLRSLCEQSKGVARFSMCGRTAKGKEIPCLEVGAGHKTLGLVGLIHGGESGPELIIPALSKLLDESPNLFQDIRIVAIPAVTIDAREDMVRGTPWYIRTNHQGVDVNRNFPAYWDTIDYGYGLDSSAPSSPTYRGPYPASAPETQAVLSVFEAHPPDAVLSFHCLAGICGMPALLSKQAIDNETHNRACLRIVEAYGKGLFPELDFSETWMHHGCSAGSLPSWLYERYGIPAFDLEGGIDTAAGKCTTDHTDRALIAEYQTRHAGAIRRLITTWK